MKVFLNVKGEVWLQVPGQPGYGFPELLQHRREDLSSHRSGVYCFS